MATSSRTAGIDTEGTNTASWTQLSCPRNSVFVVPDSISTIRAVWGLDVLESKLVYVCFHNFTYMIV